MMTYNLIIKNIAHTDIDFFSPDAKGAGVDPFIRLAFSIIQDVNLTTATKYKFFNDTINGFLIKGHETEFMNYFCKIQKTYNILNRFVFNYKYKKAKVVTNTDMFLNTLHINDKNVICIFQDNSKYLFNINDLVKISYSSLTNAYMFFSEPLPIKNPYNNIPFKKSDLYNIYFFIRYKTNLYPDLYFHFFNCDFNLSIFKYRNEYILRDYSIRNYVYTTSTDTLVPEIMKMIKYYNNYCKKGSIKNKISIDEDFPEDVLVKIFKPYLLLYLTSAYAFVGFVRHQNQVSFIRNMHRFYKFNPKFGRKIVRVQYKHGEKFGRKICGKRIEFENTHIKFNNVDKQNAKFLLDHLDCEDVHAIEITSLIQNEHIYNYDTDDTENNDNNEENTENNEEENEENAILGIINENGIINLVNANESVIENDNANESDAESDAELFVNNTEDQYCDEDEGPDDDSVS